MVALQVAALPEFRARARIETGRAVSAKVDVNAPLLGDRRRRRVGVVAIECDLRLGHVEYLDVMPHFAAREVHAQGEELRAILAPGRQPDLPVPYHGRGPTLIVNRRLPSHVLGLAEFSGEFSFDCLLTRQDYTLTVATQYPVGFSQDWLDDTIQFSVVDSKDLAGLINLRAQVSGGGSK